MKQLRKTYEELSELERFKLVLLFVIAILFVILLAILPSYLSIKLFLLVCACISFPLSFLFIKILNKSKYGKFSGDDPFCLERIKLNNYLIMTLDVIKSRYLIHIAFFIFIVLSLHLFNALTSKEYAPQIYVANSQPEFHKRISRRISESTSFYVDFPTGRYKIRLSGYRSSSVYCSFYKSKIGFHYIKFLPRKIH